MSSFPFSHPPQSGLLAKRTLPSSHPPVSPPASFSTSSWLYLTFLGRIRPLASSVCSYALSSGPQGHGSGRVLQLGSPQSREALRAACCAQWLSSSGHPVCGRVKSSFFCFPGRLVWMEKTSETAPSASASSWCSGSKGSSSMSPRWT